MFRHGLVAPPPVGDTDLGRRLVPSAAPAAALLCLYESGRPGDRLIRRERGGADRAAALAAAARSVRLSHPVGPQIRSLADTSPRFALVVAFGYPGRPDADLWYGLGEGDAYPELANGRVRVPGNARFYGGVVTRAVPAFAPYLS